MYNRAMTSIVSPENARVGQSQDLLLSHFQKVSSATDLLFSSLKGFRRDLSLTMKEFSDIEGRFDEHPHDLAISPLKTGADFKQLEGILRNAEASLEGEIHIPEHVSEKKRDSLLKELDITHKNLLDLSESAQRLYDILKECLYDFDSFNRENREKGYLDADVSFDRDAHFVSMSASRALGERAVRLDIDLMNMRHAIEFPDHRNHL